MYHILIIEDDMRIAEGIEEVGWCSAGYPGKTG